MRERHPQGGTAHLGASPHAHLIDTLATTRVGIDALDGRGAEFASFFGFLRPHTLTPSGHRGRIAWAWRLSVACLVFGFRHGSQEGHLRRSSFDDAQGNKATIHQPVVRQTPTSLMVLLDHEQGLTHIAETCDWSAREQAAQERAAQE